MSFDIQNFQDFPSEFRFGKITDYIYGSSTDDLATITAAGYFDSAPGIVVGSRLGVTGTDGSASIEVSGVGPVTTATDISGQVVSSVFGGTIQFGIGIGTVNLPLSWIIPTDMIICQIVVPDASNQFVSSAVANSGSIDVSISVSPTVSPVDVNVNILRLF